MFFLFSLVAFVALIVGLLLWRWRPAASGVFVATSGAALLALLFQVWRTDPGTASTLIDALPPTHNDKGYVGSATCQACHSDQHASWYQTYHRTMTQVATPENVLAPFDNVSLDAEGQVCRIFRRGDEFWVEMDDPEWERLAFLDEKDTRRLPAPRRVEARVVMTTGSHHFQAYWIRSEYGRELWQFPWRFDLHEKQWVHRRDVFLGPPEWRPGMHFKVWNDNCIFCHSTGGKPGLDHDSNYMTDTSVAELGIACEACHGPGASHVQRHEPSGADFSVPRGDAQETIVNPARLDHERASEICGSCHSNFLHDSPRVMVTGSAFRPGRRLTEFGRFFRPEMESADEVVSRFWADGVNRSTGREFMGVKESPCYKRGEMSCLSCHSMHDSDPDDQLKAEMDGNEACLQCHDTLRTRLTEHTHHEDASAGSQCYNCHMPHTNYGLFKATRSHQITNPQVTSIAHKSRPNACNLCHLDKSLAWTANHLSRWYGQGIPELADDERTASAWALWMLRGDAGQRVLAAWHARSPDARTASGEGWLAPIVISLIDDPYAAVRCVTRASLRSLPEFDIAMDDFADKVEREQFLSELQKVWERHATDEDRARLAEVLGAHDLASDSWERIRALQQRRDDRPIASVE